MRIFLRSLTFITNLHLFLIIFVLVLIEILFSFRKTFYGCILGIFGPFSTPLCWAYKSDGAYHGETISYCLLWLYLHFLHILFCIKIIQLMQGFAQQQRIPPVRILKKSFFEKLIVSSQETLFCKNRELLGPEAQWELYLVTIGFQTKYLSL